MTDAERQEHRNRCAKLMHDADIQKTLKKELKRDDPELYEMLFHGRERWALSDSDPKQDLMRDALQGGLPGNGKR